MVKPYCDDVYGESMSLILTDKEIILIAKTAYGVFSWRGIHPMKEKLILHPKGKKKCLHAYQCSLSFKYERIVNLSHDL